MYTHKPGIYKGKRHEFYRHTDAVAAIGKPIQEPKAFIYTSAEDKSYAETFFNEKGIDRSRTLIICPTASNYAKAWPTENYIELAKRFIQFYKGNVVITWAPNELEKVESMLAKIGEGALLTPKTTINQLAAIIAGCAVCACNNSGAMNVAMAVQAPILVFMNTSPEDWGAVGNRSISLYSSIYDERPDKKEDFLYEHQLDSETQYRLIQKITVDQAWQALQKIMAG
jgi:ADP-heptose:LPS heptosyltransferase